PVRAARGADAAPSPPGVLVLRVGRGRARGTGHRGGGDGAGVPAPGRTLHPGGPPAGRVRAVLELPVAPDGRDGAGSVRTWSGRTWRRRRGRSRRERPPPRLHTAPWPSGWRRPRRGPAGGRAG